MRPPAFLVCFVGLYVDVALTAWCDVVPCTHWTVSPSFRYSPISASKGSASEVAVGGGVVASWWRGGRRGEAQLVREIRDESGEVQSRWTEEKGVAGGGLESRYSFAALHARSFPAVTWCALPTQLYDGGVGDVLPPDNLANELQGWESGWGVEAMGGSDDEMKVRMVLRYAALVSCGGRSPPFPTVVPRRHNRGSLRVG